jgi:LysR family hydrogen peroxide-inducible transcriptional activator
MRRSPHPFTLRQLQYAVAIAETRSFRQAAALCAVSQPSLSAQLAQLERALGVTLFERTKRRVLPTRAGEELVTRATDVLRGADDLAEAAARFADPFAGTLRIGVIPTISPYLLPEIAPVLRTRHPRLRLRWTEDKTPALVARLHAGDLDAALVALEAELGDVAHETIGRDPFVLAAPLGHPLGVRTTPATPRELAGASVLLLDDGHCFRDQALDWCTRARASELDYRATSLPTLAQMVADGAGVTLLPALSVAVETQRRALRVRPFGPPAPGRTIALVWRRGTPLEPALRAVATTIADVYTRLTRTPRRRA